MSSEQKNDQGKSSGRGTEETAAARHRRLVGGLTVALLASWLLMLAPLPFSLLAGVTGLVALVLLFPLIVRSLKADRRGVAVMAIAVGIPATLMVVGISLITAVFYGPMSQMQECRASAITEQALSQCDQQAQESLSSWVTDLVGG
ncbi:MAG TPA: hypothetical protein H9786_04370 [Candidatus Brachybacterium merdavium]|uniref:Uncharacterized protein n=1 Tax=Candidatus Brachybacterium merdavium TaxID=2838513 RepID=A0A9D2RNP2_9MICO|nr:hypothetical protein [Candidatus Brachybacterium merdavium]